MIRFIARILGARTPPATQNADEHRMFPDRETMIARRALRLHNRSREGAAKYERQHTILARGRQN